MTQRGEQSGPSQAAIASIESTPAKEDSDARQTVAQVAAQGKGWLARSLGTLMQLPKSTPLAVLRWTTPEGPMPRIVHLPSREARRTVTVYLWVPPNHVNAAQDASISAPSTNSDFCFSAASRPCLIDFHGGGFIMGDPLEEAPWCSALARRGIITFSVAYRLGPVHSFPAALHDAEDVVNAVLGGNENHPRCKEAASALQAAIDAEVGSAGLMSIDREKVALSGFSSGGNVALNLLLSLSKEQLQTSSSAALEDWPSPFASSHPAPLPALLFFPSLDARQATYERKRPASMAPAGGFAKFVGQTLRHSYLPQDMLAHPRASPGLAPLSAIHPSTRALLILAEIDTLAEQSETWVNKLEQAGLAQQVEETTGVSISEPLRHDDGSAIIRVHRIKEASHGFTTFPDSFLDEKTRRIKALVMQQACQWVVNMFGDQSK